MHPRGNASLRLRNSLLGVNSFVAFPWSYMKKKLGCVPFDDLTNLSIAVLKN